MYGHVYTELFFLCCRRTPSRNAVEFAWHTRYRGRNSWQWYPHIAPILLEQNLPQYPLPIIEAATLDEFHGIACGAAVSEKSQATKLVIEQPDMLP